VECCQCKGIEMEFDEKTAGRQLRQYRKKGPPKSTRILIDALKSQGVDGMTLLDIGGGVGAIQHELLNSGVSSVTDADASTAYIQAARDEAERRGHAGQVRFYHGDFVELAADIEPADIVTLDRVLCCYPNMPAMVKLSSARARKYYGIVYPRDTWLIKLGLALANFVIRLRHSPFRVFLHPSREVDEIVRDNGLKQIFFDKTGLWQVVVYAH
jgi:2-polyprenyl-3-methyl-5-hydroxy-6-metoxy-1,4-benzoquinol methylase